MKRFFLGSAVLASLLWFSGSTAQAQVPQVNVYTGGIPAWYTWYGYPGNMSFYYGPSATPTREVVEVRAPARVTREVVYVLPRTRKTRPWRPYRSGRDGTRSPTVVKSIDQLRLILPA